MSTYPRSASYDPAMVREKIMGPNPLKLTEELMEGSGLPRGAKVLDLGSGCGITSVFLAREYGFRVTAADLWSDPAENAAFFASMGVPAGQLVPVRCDAANPAFEPEEFDAVTCIDSYAYFGRDPEYLDAKLLPYVKRGGRVYLAIAGLVKDCHDDLPPEITVSWTAEQMEYMHDMGWWRAMFGQSEDCEVESLRTMACTEEAWRDWVACDNDYARGDRKAIEAGALRHLAFIAAVLRKK